MNNSLKMNYPENFQYYKKPIKSLYKIMNSSQFKSNFKITKINPQIIVL